MNDLKEWPDSKNYICKISHIVFDFLSNQWQLIRQMTHYIDGSPLFSIVLPVTFIFNILIVHITYIFMKWI